MDYHDWPAAFDKGTGSKISTFLFLTVCFFNQSGPSKSLGRDSN